ncbi:MAG: radical enzyme Cfr family, partial [Solirubrobacterales bacterium]|nr:radical enzyme Cfr family [Solirubrobacterales bacterium]
MDLQQLDQTLADRGEPRFRAAQVWAWMARGARGYEEMTDLPASLRDALAGELPFSSLTVGEESRSSDGTVKALFATADGRPLEAVLMRYRNPPGGGDPPGGGSPQAGRNPAGGGDRPGGGDRAGGAGTGGRRSICVSSQSGCPLTCSFCATGAMRFARNLSASEIIDQALHFRRIEPIDHCVFMGMGEPMLNLE